MPAEKAKEYSDASIFIVASEGHKRKVGRAGTVTGLIDKRVKLILSDDLDPSKLHGHLNIRANISVIKKYNTGKKAYELKEVLIKSGSPKRYFFNCVVI